MRRLRLSEVALMLVRDSPGTGLNQLTRDGASWRTTWQLLKTNPMAGWALVRARLDFTKSLEDQLRSEIDSLVQLGLVEYRRPAGDCIITGRGKAHLQSRGL